MQYQTTLYRTSSRSYAGVWHTSYIHWETLCTLAQRESLHAYVIAHHECVELCQWPEERSCASVPRGADMTKAQRKAAKRARKLALLAISIRAGRSV